MAPRMLQMTITQMRRKWPFVRMKSTLTRCELRITNTMSSTSTKAATTAFAPRRDSLPGVGPPPGPGVLLLASGQPPLMGKSIDPGFVTFDAPAVLAGW
jgi:hypothetical protein